jgi:hypothetical protein
VPKREPLMTDAFFADEMAGIEKNMVSRLAKLAQQPGIYTRPEIVRGANFRDSYQLILLGYSAGEPIDVIARRLPAVVDALEGYIACPRHTPIDFGQLDDYVVALWLVSFAIVFGADGPLVRRLVDGLGNGRRDRLFERLVAARMPGRPAAGELLHPHIYAPLDAAIDASGSTRQTLMTQFLAGWIRGMEPTYWHGSHQGPDGGGFFGYWAVEAAGVSAAFGFDDSLFRDLPYYPRDLAG